LIIIEEILHVNKIEAVFVWRGPRNAAPKLEKLARASVNSFFEYAELPLGFALHLVVYEANIGADPKCRVKVSTTSPDPTNKTPGIPVIVYLTGTQGLTCLATATVGGSGMDESSLRVFIESGPYIKKKPAVKVKPVEAVQTLQVEEVIATEQAAPALETMAEALPVLAVTPAVSEPSTKVTQAVRRTPRQVLEDNLHSEEDIKKIQKTMARLIYDNTTEEERQGSWALFR
jgi:hypothetical protein